MADRETNRLGVQFITGIGRRRLLQGGATLAAFQIAAPAIIKARGEVPIKLGFIDPLTGSLSALAVSEVEGAKIAVAEINKNNGVLDRELQLLVEDSANDVGTGVQKARKLIERDQVDAIFGDVNSGVAYAIEGVTSEKKIFHIVPGGHTDPITGKDCKWNVFRICNTTAMDAAAITQTLVEKFGKRFFFITPDYAYGHTLQENFVKRLTALGGEYQGDMLPIAATDFSATLIKAKAYKPNVVLNNMGGLAQINCMKQFTQFGMQKDMALGGALFEIEVDPRRPAGSPGWLVDDGMVVGPARRAACRRLREDGEGIDRQELLLGTPLVRLCRHPLLQDRRREGEVARSDQAGQGAGGRSAAARGRVAARQGVLPRRRS